jgi:5-methyltetrahydrofolate--homocysteine methyltransferase
MADLEAVKQAVIGGRRAQAETLVREALDGGADPQAILGGALIPAMKAVGEKFRTGEFFVPEMLIAAKAMKAALEILRPRLAPGTLGAAGKIVIGTVRGDLHDIGKNLVKIMLEGAGFEVVDLGVDVAPEAFVEAVRTHQPRIVAMSALLTTTMLAMPDTLKALRDAGLRDTVKVIIGGAAVTDDFAREIGADGFGADAHTGAELARRLVN